VSSANFYTEELGMILNKSGITNSLFTPNRLMVGVGVAYSSGLFVAVGQLRTVLTSPDGISWAGQYSGQLTHLLSVVCGSAGFAAISSGGTIFLSRRFSMTQQYFFVQFRVRH
jgi:hypothetical protein